MSFPSLEKCLEQISNRYVLVVLAAKRSRQLNRGAQPQVETKRRKWTSVALEEVHRGQDPAEEAGGDRQDRRAPAA